MPLNPKVMGVDEACHVLGGISKSKLYLLIADGQLPVVKIGRRTFVRPEDIDALIERGRASQPVVVA